MDGGRERNGALPTRGARLHDPPMLASLGFAALEWNELSARLGAWFRAAPEALGAWIRAASDWIWDLPLLLLVMGGGLFFLVRSRLGPFVHFGHAVGVLTGRHDRPDAPGEVSHYQALSVALAATVGMGNISGVAVAIGMGGPGAIFWMWVAAIVGTATKYFECTLAVLYRGRDSLGHIQGGPMYVITEGLGRRWRPLAVLFAMAGIFGCLPVFNANQLSAAIAHITLDAQLEGERGGLHIVIGAGLAALTSLVIFGGLQRIGRVVSLLVPFMVLVYFVLVAGILWAHMDALPRIFVSIVRDGFEAGHFNGEAMFGGALGGLIVLGARRASFSNEAGLGTAAMAHGAARTAEPVHEGLVAMLGPMIDTLFVCTLTALAILATGVHESTDSKGVLMTLAAFQDVYPKAGGALLLVCIACFSLSSLFTYAYFGGKCFGFLFGAERAGLYRWLYIASITLGAAASLKTAVSFIDLMFALMAIPTMVSALLLSSAVMRETDRYWARYWAARRPGATLSAHAKPRE